MWWAGAGAPLLAAFSQGAGRRQKYFPEVDVLDVRNFDGPPPPIRRFL